LEISPKFSIKNFDLFSSSSHFANIIHFLAKFLFGIEFAHSALHKNSIGTVRSALWASQLQFKKNVICLVTL